MLQIGLMTASGNVASAIGWHETALVGRPSDARIPEPDLGGG